MTVITDFVREMIATDTSARATGIELLSAQDGEATARLVVPPGEANGHGICHGGAIFSLADTTFACAANSVMPGSVTAEASILFLSPARIGEEMIADGKVRHTTSRQTVVDVTVRVGERVIAEFRGRGALLSTRTDGSST